MDSYCREKMVRMAEKSAKRLTFLQIQGFCASGEARQRAEEIDAALRRHQLRASLDLEELLRL